MVSFQSKYEELVSKVVTEWSDALNPLNELQDKYIATMGFEDQMIVNKIKGLYQNYEVKLARLNDQKKKFDSLMSVSDSDLKIMNCKERVDLSDFADYPDAKTRKLTSSNYWGAIFQSQLSSIEIKKLPLPKIEEPTVSRLYEELAQVSPDSDLIIRVNESISALERSVGKLYDFHTLTKDELFKLDSGLKEYMAQPSSRRVERLLTFLDRYVSDFEWEMLDPEERSSIKYSRQRDRNSAPDGHGAMIARREIILAGAVLKAYTKMTQDNREFRTNNMWLGSSEWQKSGEANIPAVFYIEQFLVGDVRNTRDPIYAQKTYDSIMSIINFHRKIEQILTPGELASLAVDYPITKLNDLGYYYKAHNKLTPPQRRFAFDLITKYSVLVEISDVWTPEHILKLSETQPQLVGKNE